MIWFRVAIFLAIAFAVARAISRAWRLTAHSAAVRHIQEEIRMLKAGLEAGIYTDAEYGERRERIRALCAKQGIGIPELPAHITPKDEDLES